MLKIEKEKNYCPKFIYRMLILFFWATPLDYVLPHFGSATILLVLGLLISAYSVFDLIFRVGRFYLKQEDLIIVYLAFLSLVSLAWADNLYRAQSDLVSYLATYAMYFLLFAYRFSEKQIARIEYASVFGGVCMLVYVFTQVDMSLINGGYRLDFNNIGGEAFSDPNGLAARLMMPLVFSIKGLFERKKNLQRIVFLLSAGSIVYIIFLTGSRAGVLALLGVLFFVLQKHMSARRLGTFLAIIILIVVSIFLLLQILPDHITGRLFNIDNYREVATKEGDRIDIWKNLFTRVFPKSPIWGYGIGNAALAMSDVYYRTKAVHNSWFMVLLDLGIIGFIPWVVFTFRKVKRAYLLRKENYAFVATVGTFLMALTLDGTKEKYLWNVFLYIHMVSTLYASSAKTVEQSNRYNVEEHVEVKTVQEGSDA